jgi:hypothetical protein
MAQTDTVASRVAARVLHAMAYDRNEFRNKLEEHIGGAYLEFYKARLASKNGQTKWVKHWLTEVRQLLDRNLVAAMLHEIRGFKDRRKVYEQVCTAMKAKDAGYRLAAENTVLRDYGLRKVRMLLDDQDTTNFWALVEQAVDTGLAGKADVELQAQPQGKRDKGRGKPEKGDNGRGKGDKRKRASAS